MTKEQIVKAIEEATSLPLIRSTLLPDTYAVSPDNSIMAKDDYNEQEWDDIWMGDNCFFQEGSSANIMLTFMLINAGLAPV